MSRGVVYKGHRIAAARMETLQPPTSAPHFTPQLQKLQKRVERLEDAVDTLISDFDSRLKKLGFLAAEPFLERIKTLLESDPTVVPEFRDKMRLNELSQCDDEGLRHTANMLRAEIVRRLTL